jgi:hypothetical protein
MILTHHPKEIRCRFAGVLTARSGPVINGIGGLLRRTILMPALFSELEKSRPASTLIAFNLSSQARPQEPSCAAWSIRRTTLPCRSVSIPSRYALQ